MLTILPASAYLHSIDPVIFPIAGDLAVRWYGLSYLAGFIIAWLLILWLAKSGRSAIPVKFIGDLMLAVVIGVLAGGRLGYVLFYEPSLFVRFLDQFPWWGVLAINLGGMSSHGGMIGAILACAWFARKHNVATLHILDVGALVATPGLFLGRIANFINAELWGRKLPEAMQANPPWWSVKYPQEMRRWPGEDLATLRDLMPEVGVDRTEWTHATGMIAIQPDDPPREALQIVHRGIDRLIEAVREGNELVIETLQPMLDAYYPSQIFQAITDGPILAAVLVLVWLRPRKPGVIAGTFLVSYGVLRIGTEVFRQPDTGVALLLGLSRGQVLSVLMVLGGAAMVWWCSKRDVQPMGGLLETSRRPNV